MKKFLQNVRKNKICYIYLFPFFSLFTVFVILPVLMAMVLSFTDYNLLQAPQFVGFQNYADLFFNDEIFMKAVVNTLTMALVVGPFSYIGALMLAWVLNEMNRGTRTVMVFLIYAPSISGNAFMIWQLLFSGDQLGYINALLIEFGLITAPIQFLTDTKYMMTAVIIVTMWTSMGTQFLSFVAGLQSLDRAYFEAAAIDGLKNRWQELYYVTFPQMGPQLMFGAVTSISSAFAVGYHNRVLTGFPSTEYSTHTLLLHAIDYADIRYELGYSSAISVVLFAMMILSWVVIQGVLKKFND